MHHHFLQAVAPQLVHFILFSPLSTTVLTIIDMLIKQLMNLFSMPIFTVTVLAPLPVSVIIILMICTFASYMTDTQLKDAPLLQQNVK